MAIGIGLHCWYCEHGPCDGLCRKDDENDTQSHIKAKKRESKINSILSEEQVNIESNRKKEN